MGVVQRLFVHNVTEKQPVYSALRGPTFHRMHASDGCDCLCGDDFGCIRNRIQVLSQFTAFLQ